jgi:simple sugar transport system permease protein
MTTSKVSDILPKQFIQMIPFIVPLVVLSVTSKKSKAPKAIGQIYDKSKR